MIQIVVGNITNRERVTKDPAVTTPRQVLEEQGLDYSGCRTDLDGVSLKVADFDKTFAELGVRDHCYLMLVEHKENAAKVLVLGSAMVVRSDIPLAMIKEMGIYSPDLLDVVDWENGKEVTTFAICATPEGAGSLTDHGAAFSPHGSTAGEGVITINIPETVTDRAKYIKETYGRALLKLNELESRVRRDYESGVKAAIEQVDGMIEIL